MFKKLTSSFCIKFVLIAHSLFLYSCDSSSSSSDFTIIEESNGSKSFSGLVIDPDFQSTVDRFIFEAEKRNISVNLNNMEILYGETNDALGTCSVQGSFRKITINPILQTASDDLLSEIIIHELGHCVLGREHSPDPTSIMHATNIIGEPWRTEVLDELFFGS